MRSEEHNGGEDSRGGKAIASRTIFSFFSFATCNRYYVGSYCVRVIVTLSVDE